MQTRTHLTDSTANRTACNRDASLGTAFPRFMEIGTRYQGRAWCGACRTSPLFSRLVAESFEPEGPPSALYLQLAGK